MSVAEQAIAAGREHREEMTRWLALEVLLSDELAGRDEVLVERLGVLQEAVEERLRARTAPREQPVGERAGDERPGGGQPGGGRAGGEWPGVEGAGGE